jgi:hypothetical protein
MMGKIASIQKRSGTEHTRGTNPMPEHVEIVVQDKADGSARVDADWIEVSTGMPFTGKNACCCG